MEALKDEEKVLVVQSAEWCRIWAQEVGHTGRRLEAAQQIKLRCSQREEGDGGLDGGRDLSKKNLGWKDGPRQEEGRRQRKLS